MVFVKRKDTFMEEFNNNLLLNFTIITLILSVKLCIIKA